MRNYIYKTIITIIAVIVVFEFTVGKEIGQINENINYFTKPEGRKKIIASIKKHLRQANEQEDYLDDEERVLINNFIIKIKKELSSSN